LNLRPPGPEPDRLLSSNLLITGDIFDSLFSISCGNQLIRVERRCFYVYKFVYKHVRLFPERRSATAESLFGLVSESDCSDRTAADNTRTTSGCALHYDQLFAELEPATGCRRSRPRHALSEVYATGWPDGRGGSPARYVCSAEMWRIRGKTSPAMANVAPGFPKAMYRFLYIE
jgi:hypothetical protein